MNVDSSKKNKQDNNKNTMNVDKNIIDYYRLCKCKEKVIRK